MSSRVICTQDSMIMPETMRKRCFQGNRDLFPDGSIIYKWKRTEATQTNARRSIAPCQSKACLSRCVCEEYRPVLMLMGEQAALIGKRFKGSLMKACFTARMCEPQQTVGDPCRAIDKAGQRLIHRDGLPANPLFHALSMSQ